jgi:hypothetical protein
MSETKKGGFIKRLFGGKKESCCGVQIKDEPRKGKKEPGNPSECCTSDNKQE